MKIIYILISVLAGVVITIIATKILGKRSRFSVERNDEEFGQGHNLPIGANLRVLHGEREITNFQISRFSIKNESTTDFENVKIRVWSGPGRFILHDTISKAGFLDEIPYHPEFVASLQMDEHDQYSAIQYNKYDTQREYSIPTFNRFETVKIVVVSTAGTETQSGVWIEIPHTGIRADDKYYRTYFFGAPNDEIWLFAFTFMIISIILPIIFFRDPWIIAIIAGLGSGFSTFIAAVIYRIRKWLLKIIAD